MLSKQNVRPFHLRVPTNQAHTGLDSVNLEFPHASIHNRRSVHQLGVWPGSLPPRFLCQTSERNKKGLSQLTRRDSGRPTLDNDA